ncbi:hypothetical protein BGX38DRAFT_257727 [Terfezia claveryi]|nr:hypothetical protein BGX38DRAFT_257727 [Terfezia claveryi]
MEDAFENTIKAVDPAFLEFWRPGILGERVRREGAGGDICRLQSPSLKAITTHHHRKSNQPTNLHARMQDPRTHTSIHSGHDKKVWFFLFSFRSWAWFRRNFFFPFLGGLAEAGIVNAANNSGILLHIPCWRAITMSTNTIACSHSSRRSIQTFR